SIDEIAHDAKLDKSHVARRLDAVGLSRRRFGTAIDEHWLVEQYAIEQRPAQDIAAELDLSSDTVKRALKGLGIELRPAHERTVWPASLVTNAPEALKPALKHRGDLKRLDLFTSAMAFGTLVEAARSLGISLRTLSTQLRKLEEHVGCK